MTRSRVAPRPRRDSTLGLWDTTAMAVGGMIGGGLFTVLGVAISLAGHLAAGCFVLGMALAALTAHSYAGMARRSPGAAGLFTYLRSVGHQRLAGTLVWVLVVAYVAVMAVYSFTFGRYAADALGASTAVARLLTVAIVVVLLVVNLRGVVLSRRTEDSIVVAKIVVLAAIAMAGISRFEAERLTPVADQGWAGLLIGAAVVFVAYEGFELISYDAADIRDAPRTMPRALYLSVAIVAFVYVSVTLGAQMLVPDAAIVAERDVAFTVIGEAAFGQAGRWAAILGALLATTSAMNATIFSAARLVRDGSHAGDLPMAFGRETAGVPVIALTAISLAGAALAMVPRLTEVIAFASAAFLVIYTAVNLFEARAADAAPDRRLAVVAATGCLIALAALLWQLATDDLAGLLLLAVVGLATGGGRWLQLRGDGGRRGPTSRGLRPKASPMAAAVRGRIVT